ncbi:hypothetical protein DERA104750_01305 [Deinococcus radiodurans]
MTAQLLIVETQKLLRRELFCHHSSLSGLGQRS